VLDQSGCWLGHRDTGKWVTWRAMPLPASAASCLMYGWLAGGLAGWRAKGRRPPTLLSRERDPLTELLLKTPFSPASVTAPDGSCVLSPDGEGVMRKMC
jgi:hypothetical protein